LVRRTALNGGLSRAHAAIGWSECVHLRILLNQCFGGQPPRQATRWLPAEGRESDVTAGCKPSEGWCRRWESNPHSPLSERDFESRASASFTTPALRESITDASTYRCRRADRVLPGARGRLQPRRPEFAITLGGKCAPRARPVCQPRTVGAGESWMPAGNSRNQAQINARSLLNSWQASCAMTSAITASPRTRRRST
jgi:hypothetical protein